MPRDPTGRYFLPTGNPVRSNTIITSGTAGVPGSGWANPTLSDIAAALTDSVPRSGSVPLLGPLNMNGYKITNVGYATAATDVPQAQQIRDRVFNGLVATSDATGNNYTGTSSLTVPPVQGTTYQFFADKTNTGPMTVAVNGGAALPILINGAAVPPGLVIAGSAQSITYVSLTYRLHGITSVAGTVNSVVSSDPALISVNTTANIATLTPHANVAGGMTKLDGSAKVPVAQLPFQDLFFVGIWNAAPGTNPSTTGINNGDFYVITVAGTLTIYRTSGGNVYTPQSTPVVVGDAIILRKGSVDPNAPDGWYFDPAAARPAVASTVSMNPTSANAPFAGITDVQAWMNAADPAILARLPLAGGTMSGPIVQPALPSAASHLANKQYVDSQTAGLVGVVSFNSRTGAVNLTAPDVYGALGFTPATTNNPAFTGHMTGGTAVFTGGVGSLYYAPMLFASSIGGTSFLSFFNGQVQNLGLVADLILTSIENMVAGALLRLVFNATNLYTITWPGNVYWPMGVVPALGAGPNGVAVVVLVYAGGGTGSGGASPGTILGAATMY